MNKIINILKEKKSIPLDQYINFALYDKKFGYYMKKNPFGKKGDFITSPLISNLFSEMLAVWCVSFWEKIGKPKKILMVELGPGDGSLCNDILETFKKLMELAEQLKEEEKRYIKEELENDNQLAMFDLLTKPEPKLTDKEKKAVKAVSRTLYDKLTEGVLTLDWRKKQEKKAEVKVKIKTILNDGLPEVYDKRIFDDKRSSLYDYVFETM